MKLYYDFHIHSCLSPCGEEEMTPNNIVNMAVLAGLNVIAVTDHNSCGNCKAVIDAAKNNGTGLVVLAGMELETREETHLLCLFETLQGALGFEKTIRPLLPPIKNHPDIYGPQILMDADDKIIGEEKQLLVVAADLSLEEAVRLAGQHGGVAIAAHLDRNSNSVISNLGFLSPDMGFASIELSRRINPENIPAFVEKHKLTEYNRIGDSDAHRLEDIQDAAFFLEIDAPTPAAIIRRLSQKPT